MLLFRIEDSENIDGNHRRYQIPKKERPVIRLSQLDDYIATEIRKEVNNCNDRRLLSYSKSLGVCLLKYNKYTDNELHIKILKNPYILNAVKYKIVKTKEKKCIIFDLKEKNTLKEDKKIRIDNFVLDISDNKILNEYLKDRTQKGLKKVASPEKDHEVVVMRSPNDLIIVDYLESVYLLYALYLKYGMNQHIFCSLLERIESLEDFRFANSKKSERESLKIIVMYLYHLGKEEKEMSYKILQDSKNSDEIYFFYNPIVQLHDILNNGFDYAYSLSEYNSNVISDYIWKLYGYFR